MVDREMRESYKLSMRCDLRTFADILKLVEKRGGTVSQILIGEQKPLDMQLAEMVQESPGSL